MKHTDINVGDKIKVTLVTSDQESISDGSDVSGCAVSSVTTTTYVWVGIATEVSTKGVQVDGTKLFTVPGEYTFEITAKAKSVHDIYRVVKVHDYDRDNERELMVETAHGDPKEIHIGAWSSGADGGGTFAALTPEEALAFGENVVARALALLEV